MNKDTYALENALIKALRIQAVVNYIESNVEDDNEYQYYKCDEMLKTIKPLVDKARDNLHMTLYKYLDLNVKGYE